MLLFRYKTINESFVYYYLIKKYNYKDSIKETDSKLEIRDIVITEELLISDPAAEIVRTTPTGRHAFGSLVFS